MNKIQQVESHHFKIFRYLYKDMPDGEVHHTDKPDFLVFSEKGTIGLEHQQVFKPDHKGKYPLQSIESQFEEILAQAQEHAELRGTPPVHVGLVFQKNPTIQKRKRIEIARNITRFIHANLPEIGQTKTIEKNRRTFKGYMPEILDKVYITRDKERKRHHWCAPKADWAVKDCREILQSAINDKALKIENYLRNCDVCWLLLVANSTKPSGFIHANDVSLRHFYQSPFEKNFFLDCGLQKINLLNITTTAYL